MKFLILRKSHKKEATTTTTTVTQRKTEVLSAVERPSSAEGIGSPLKMSDKTREEDHIKYILPKKIDLFQ